jgi:hypothetical protein
LNTVYQIFTERSIERTKAANHRQAIRRIPVQSVSTLTQAEGLVTGAAVGTFTIAGPVIVSGTAAGVLRVLAPVLPGYGG